ncbi:DUF3618 domain-containing protein [Streptomyces sp. NPDC041068]|uniref:DUF3618 domain-containing protein n=1 Tax=Streptomyces sp. NPDC041068 TaxID=3155130 RepID=UPI0033D78790
MGATPDELRQDADTTRAHLAQTADRLAEKVSPQRVVRRRSRAARQRLGTVKDRVMGTAGTGRDRLSARTHETAAASERLGQQVREAPEAIRSQARGTPLAAGLVAFGTGVLLGGLFPASEAEERAGQRLRERSEELAGPVKETVREAAEGVKEEMREPVREAAESVKGTAQDAARSTGEEARRAGGEGARQIKGRPGDA